MPSGKPKSNQPKSAKQVERAARAERAAAAIRERQARERRRRNASIAAVVVVIALVVGVGFWISSRSSDNSESVAAAAPGPGSAHGLTIGPSTAPHKVVVYEDFLCPFCGEFEKATHEKLEALADSGQVQVEYRPFEFLTRFGDYSANATEAFASVLTESGDEAALKFHDLLFADQPEEDGPFPSTSKLADLMTQAGADAATVTSYKSGGGETWAQEATDAANDVGVDRTPTIILDGKAFPQGGSVDETAANLLKAVQ